MSAEGDALGVAVANAVANATSAMIAAGQVPVDRIALFKALGNALFDNFAPDQLETADKVVALLGSIPEGTFLAMVGGKIVGEALPTGLPPIGAAGGDLTGTYPSPAIAAGAVTAAKIASATITDVQVAAANKDGASATPSLRTLGTGAAQACAGNDSRLSDARAPTGSAGGDLTGSYPSPTVAALAITDSKVAAANKDGAAGTPSMRTLGTGAAQACAGNDSRLSDSRAPTGSAGGDLTGTYPNPTLAAAGAGAGTYGGGSLYVNSITLDSKGRPTAITTGTPSGGGAGTGWAANKVSSLALLAGLDLTKCSVYGSENVSLADWFVNAGTWTVPSTAKRGGAFQNNSSGAASLFLGGTIPAAGGTVTSYTQHPTKLGGAGYGWGLSMVFAIESSVDSSSFFLLSLSTNASPSSPNGIQFGFHGGVSTAKYLAYSNDGTTVHSYLSTIGVDTGYHAIDVWYNPTTNKYFLSVDGETAIEITSIGTLSQATTCAVMLTCDTHGGVVKPQVFNRFVMVTGSEN